jgi:poly-gamma-glutamate synthase PgsB/CapB
MTGMDALVAITAILIALGIAEMVVHRRRLGRIGVRIHVNGTRGKSSVVRLIAAGLRASGKRVCAKTTGSLARMILPDGRELPIFRPAGANIIEQKRIVAAANAYGAEVLVIECMALSPILQSLCELELVRSTHGVITNARPDHLEEMGPDAAGVARALAGTTPRRGVLFTTEHDNLDILRRATDDRESRLVTVARLEEMLGEEEAAAALEGFSYTEHADNVAIALAICRELDVDDVTALEGMHGAAPDPGAMTERELDFFGRAITFVNGFAANDEVSTRQIWAMARERHRDKTTSIAVFNCRADRPRRSLLLGRAYVEWEPADKVVLMGSGTFVFADAALKAGLDPSKLVFVEGLSVEQTFERIISLVGRSALVMGMGNAGGGGLGLASYFDNRALPEGES